jgi:hypothetical protein
METSVITKIVELESRMDEVEIRQERSEGQLQQMHLDIYGSPRMRVASLGERIQMIERLLGAISVGLVVVVMLFLLILVRLTFP